MNDNVLIFEGYDGSGKSTLIAELLVALHGKTVRVIGRKTEEQLIAISRIIEDPDHSLSNEAEMLLRVALELERLIIVSECRSRFDYVIMDRGPISVKAWARYYDLKFAEYKSLFETIERRLVGATVFLCHCDFEQCWSRIGGKEAPSKKELLGKETNRVWFERYAQVCNESHGKGYKIVDVATECDISHSLSTIVNAI